MINTQEYNKNIEHGLFFYFRHFLVPGLKMGQYLHVPRTEYRLPARNGSLRHWVYLCDRRSRSSNPMAQVA